MNISKKSLIPQSVAVLYMAAAAEEGKEPEIFALPVSDSLNSSMGWYMSFAGLSYNNGNEAFLCNSKNNVRVFKSLDSLFKVAQDNFIGLVTVCCI
jgi:predicted TIM-barrel enzyme